MTVELLPGVTGVLVLANGTVLQGVGVGATGLESDDNALLVLGREGLERALGPASKTELAASLLDLIAERLR